MSISNSLPFKPEASAWPWAPIYTGDLSPEFEQQLIDAKIITGNDKEAFDKAFTHASARPTRDAVSQFLNRFSYRLYRLNPLAADWKAQASDGAQGFVAGNPNSVKRSYAHPFATSSANDLVIEIDNQNKITTHSLLTTDAAICFLGDQATGPTIYELYFDCDALNLHVRRAGNERSFGEREYVSQRHAEHFFDWHRAASAGIPFDYAPEDRSTGPYILFEFTTQKEARFAHYWDNSDRFLFHSQLFHPSYFKDKTPQEIADWHGWKRLYSSEVTVPKGARLKAWAGRNSRIEMTFTADDNSTFFYLNQTRILPTMPTWKPGQKERYEKSSAIFRSGHYSYQGMVDLYDPKQDADHPWWLVHMGLAYANPRDSFYDEKKSYDFNVKAYELGNATAAYNLGCQWRDGDFGRIDIEKAKMWYERAFNEDEAQAGIALFNILRKDERYKNGEPEFKAAADAIFVRARKIGDEWAKYNDASFELSGFWGARNSARGILLLEQQANTKPIETRPPVMAAYQLAMRHYLGLDVPRDLDKALAYLDRIPTDKGDNVVQPIYKTNADKLRLLIQCEKDPKTMAAYRDPVAMDAKKLADEKEQERAQPQPAPSLRPNPQPAARPQAATPTPQPIDDDAVKVILGVGAAALAGVAYVTWTFRNEASAIAAGLVVTGGVFKAAHDFEANNVVKFGLTGLAALGAGFCTYMVGTDNMPEGTLVGQIWENRWAITTGLGAVTGAYVFVRDWLKDELGWGTALKTGISGAVVAGSLYLSGILEQPKQAAVQDDISVANAFVATKQINVRSSDRVERDNVVGQLSCGNGVHTVNGITDNWTEIVLPDRTHAFIASRYLSTSQPGADQCQP